MRIVAPTRNEVLRTIGGIVLIAIALKLPGIEIVSGRGWGASGDRSGWWCAWVAHLMLKTFPATLVDWLQTPPRSFSEALTTCLFSMTGLINPLLALSLFPNRWWQYRCAQAIALCLVGTWLAMLFSSFIPLIGHFLWVAGILAILSREWYQEPLVSYRARWGSAGSD